MTTETFDDDAAYAIRVVSMHGGAADVATSLPGVVNRVLRVTGPGTDWVVRFAADARRPNEFPTEVWAARLGSRYGIATPRVVGTGHLEDRAYLVVEHVEPQEEQDTDESWRWLGRYAAILPTVPLDHDAPEEIFSRFGRDLPLAWRAHLDYNLDALSERDPLSEEGVYRPHDRAHLRSLLDRLRSADFTFGLAHGDLAPRNLIQRRPPSPAVLLDWGTATTGPAPWTDLQRVYAWAVHDRTVQSSALDLFADAAGVRLDEQATAILEQLTALRLLDLARWARERRPDLYDQYRRSSQLGLATLVGGP